MKIGLYPICGDVIHAGHILAIEEAAKHCDWLVVALNCKPDGKEPIQSIYERYIQLRGLKHVDEIICYEGKSDMELLCRSFDYDIRFVGEDYRGREWDGKYTELLDGKEIHYLKRRHKLSSTELKERIRGDENE